MITLDQAGKGRAWLALAAPGAPLARMAECCWIQARPVPGVGHWRIVPDDAPHLLWHRYRDDAGGARSRLLVVGARTVYTDAAVHDRAFTAGVRLCAGAIPALFRVPAGELTDRVVPLETLAGATAREFGERLLAAPPARWMPLLDQLLVRLARGRAIAPRAATLHDLLDAGGPPLTRAAGLLGVAERTLRLLSRAEIGLRARDVRRIRRLHRALHLGLSRSRDWTTAAADAGYADQSHLTRECRALLGESPTAFAARTAN